MNELDEFMELVGTRVNDESEGKLKYFKNQIGDSKGNQMLLVFKESSINSRDFLINLILKNKVNIDLANYEFVGTHPQDYIIPSFGRIK